MSSGPSQYDAASRVVRDLDAAVRPLEELVAIGRGERDHVGGIRGHEVLLPANRARERGLEERTRCFSVSARPSDPPPLEVDARTRRCALRPSSGVVGQGVGALELAAQPFDAGELSQDLRATVLRLLGIELLAESLFGRVEVVEVPERP